MFAKSQLKDAKSELKAAERHIKPGTYAVDSNGKVTMTYVDGNGDDVANEKAVIENINAIIFNWEFNIFRICCERRESFL